MQPQHHYITTPIYYVNDEPHIGHTYTTILADVISRYHRMHDPESYFLTGTDEHGQKVQQAAEKRGVTPQTHCDEYMARFRSLWKELNISNDDFIRTTEKRHTVIVQKLLQDLYDNGDIYLAQYDGLYSVSEERFITQKEYEEGNFREVKTISESNYFFRMGKYQQQLIDHINENPDFIRPENRKNEILGFLSGELGDLCISRPKARLSWGVELPFDKDYVTYVWFDALTNYISAIGYGSGDSSKYNKYWPGIHLIGKDILTTHSVYWPTMLMAAGIPLPRQIFAHGWWMSEGRKMSKSLGNFIDLKTIREHSANVGNDPFKYFLVKEGPLFGDSDFSRLRFYQTYNTDLANDLGNLVNRIFTLINKYFDGKVPLPGEFSSEERELQKSGDELENQVYDLLDKFQLGDLVFQLISYIRDINRYMENRAPWKLAKSDLSAAGTVLYASLASLRRAVALLQPVLPEKSAEFFRLLNEENISGSIPAWDSLESGRQLQNTSGLFPRFDLKQLEDKTLDKKIEKSNDQDNKKADKADSKGPDKTSGLIDIQDFAAVDMRVAEVVSAEKVENSDKLLKLQVAIAEEKRTLVAGIAKYYTPEELIGRQVIMVYNLKPASIFGIESRGMVLTAQKGKKLVLIGPQGEIPGAAKIK